MMTHDDDPKIDYEAGLVRDHEAVQLRTWMRYGLAALVLLTAATLRMCESTDKLCQNHVQCSSWMVAASECRSHD